MRPYVAANGKALPGLNARIRLRWNAGESATRIAAREGKKPRTIEEAARKMRKGSRE